MKLGRDRGKKGRKGGRKGGEKHPADFSLHLGGNFERMQKGLENIRKY